MRRRILITTLVVTVAAVLMFAVPLSVVVGRLLDEQTALRVERQAVVTARDVPPNFATVNVTPELPVGGDVEYALYAADGRRIAGSGPNTIDSVSQGALANQIVAGERAEGLIVAVPIVDNGNVTGVLRAEQPTSAIDSRRTRAVTLIAALGASIAIIAAIAASVVASRLARPIRQIRDAAVQLGTGDFAVDIPTSRIPELADTASSLAAAAKRLETLVNRERSFSADASHQLRTPLTAMRTTLESELLFPQADPTAAIRDVLGDIDRLEVTINELLLLARTSDRPAAIELGPVLNDLGGAWAHRAAAHGRNLRVEPARYTPPVLGNPTMLRHALDVLIDNALVHGNGDITITLTTEDHTVTISVNDDGPGFATTSIGDLAAPIPQQSQRTGHGLALAHRLVGAQHGRLDVSPPPGGHVAIRLRRA